MRRRTPRKSCCSLCATCTIIQGDLESETDRKYRALGASLSVVSPHDPAYRQVERRVLDTQSARHGFKLKVNQVFTTELPEERRRFEADGKTVGNLQGLFHGTKNCNMAGILSRGLLIAPKNAPVSGYMFGKGIYFADQSSKSAQYSLVWANNKRDVGYLFLADVALGRIKTEQAPTYREEAPRGFHSVQGCKGSHLIHNEFIIYKTVAMHPALHRRDWDGVGKEVPPAPNNGGSRTEADKEGAASSAPTNSCSPIIGGWGDFYF